MEKYIFEPAHDLPVPSISWDAMLRFTKVELELLTYIEMFIFLKKGGVSQCGKRSAIANNIWTL